MLAVFLFLFWLFFLNEETDNVNEPERTDTNMEQSVNEEEKVLIGEGAARLIGQSAKDITNQYGEPDRKDPTTYGYDWWIYNKSDATYLQVGVKDDKVVTVYSIGDKLDMSPFKIGQPVRELFQNIDIASMVDIKWDGGSYQFELSEEDMNIKPLVDLGNGVYAQVYIDKFESTVSSVRFLDAETLILMRPYGLVYRGSLPEEAEVPEDESDRVDDGNERQIFDLTNIFRARMGLNKVQWDEATSEVALGHSKEMHDEEYFSHVSAKEGELKDRLAKGEVKYTMAGENIAAQYVDGAAAFEGWVNSQGHREALLNKEFTHLGVGVYKKYYTQNFIKKM
ncbi:MAG: CAP domain-containing protein [Bacillus sp. (in: firmicutes)]